MRNAFTNSGERVRTTGEKRNLGHGHQNEVIYSDDSTGWEHIEDLEFITSVEFKDDNHTMAIVRGYDEEQSAASALEEFLSDQGNEYSSDLNGAEEEDEQGNTVFYFTVLDNS